MTDEYVLVEKKDNGGGIMNLIVAILVAPFLFVMSTYDSFRASHIASRVRQGRFDVVWVKESERDAEQKILAKCKGLWDETKPAIKISKEELWFKVDQSKYQGSPKPAWIRRMGENYACPIYGVFVGPKPIQQLRNWLKENGYYKDLAYGGDGELVSTENYTPQNFRLEYTASDSVETPHFGELWRNKEKTSLEVEGLIETSWGMWHWDGERVSDISRHSYDEQNWRRNISVKLRDALLPVSRNLYRRTGLAYVAKSIWTRTYLVLAVIINVLPFIAAINVWTTKSGARPPIPMLIFRFFGWWFTLLFIPFTLIMTAGGQGGPGIDWWSAKWGVLIMVIGSTLFTWIVQTTLMNAFAKDELPVYRQYGRRPYWDSWEWPIHTATERERWTGVEETA